MGVTCCGVGQDFADEVNRALNFEDVPVLMALHDERGAHHLRGGRYVEQQSLPICGGTRTGARVKRPLSLSRASWASCVQTK